MLLVKSLKENYGNYIKRNFKERIFVMNQTIDIINNHKSRRSYLDKDIPDAMLTEILQASQNMPTSINGQQTSVIVIKNKETKNKIAELAGNQKWITEAPVFLVYVIDFNKTNYAVKLNDQTQIIHESIESTLVGTFDAGLQMAGAIVAAESLGLGIVPIGGIRNKPNEIIELLELPELTFPVVGLCIGYPNDKVEKKPRLPIKTYVHHEKYCNVELSNTIDTYDQTIKQYLENANNTNVSEHPWSSRVSSFYNKIYYPNVYEAMKKQGFLNNK